MTRPIALIAFLRSSLLAVVAATAITALVLSAASKAQAACDPAASAGLNPPPGTVVTCTGTTITQNPPIGYGTGSQDGLTVNNFGTISSLTGAPGLFLDSDNTINNSGAITSASGEGIRSGTGTTITNSGAISGSIGVVSGAGATITNSGAITGRSGFAITSGAGTTLTNTGSITGSSGVSGAVSLSGGGNTIINSGTITGLGAGGAISSTGGAGTDIVDNSGTITGSVDLGTGTNAFNNRAGGVFNAGATVNLGAGNTLTNQGTLAPGGSGTIQTTALTGNIVQSGTGTFAVDLNLAGATADRLNVTGSANLAGTVDVNVTTLPGTLTQQFTILSATGGTTNNGLGLDASPALNASLTFPNATDVVLGITVDFSTSGLNANQTAIARYMDASLGAGAGALGPVLLGLLNTAGLDAYKAALDELSPEIYSDTQITALYAALAFADNLLSCRVNGPDTASIIREGQCLWAGANARFLDSGTTFEQIGFNEAAGLFSAGGQVALDDAWRLGFGAGYQSSSLAMATNATSEGELAQGGVAVKYNPGPLLLAGELSGGRGWYDTTRPMAFGGFAATATGNQEVGIFNGGVRAAYVLGSPHLYFKPMLNAAATRLNLGDLAETGGGAANLAMQSSDQTIYTISPALEMGTEWWLANGTLIRPFLRAGASWYGGDNLALSASFLSAPEGVSPFTIHTQFDDVMGLVGAGFDMINTGDTALRLTYDGQLGDTTQIHSVGLKGSAKF
jgi:outer membrane autotransporter protein